MKFEDKSTSQHKVTINRFEQNEAVVLVEGEKAELKILKKMLPKTAKEGESLILTVSTEQAETKRREQTAKDILNEILKS